MIISIKQINETRRKGNTQLITENTVPLILGVFCPSLLLPCQPAKPSQAPISHSFLILTSLSTYETLRHVSFTST